MGNPPSEKLHRILHINNTAGVGSLIIQELEKDPCYKFDMIMRKLNDPFGFTPAKWLNYDLKYIFIIKALLKSLNADIIHLHGRDRFLRYLKFLGTPVIMHYHGTDIKNKWKEKEYMYKHAFFVIVSTPDLLEGAPDYVKYLENPIDRNHFKYLEKVEGNRAFTFHHGADELAMQVAKKYGVELDILDRSVSYLELPKVMEKYKYYVEMKKVNDTIYPSPEAPSHSKTCLEALSRGLTVLRPDEIIDKFPEQHDSKRVAEKWRNLYNVIISGT